MGAAAAAVRALWKALVVELVGGRTVQPPAPVLAAVQPYPLHLPPPPPRALQPSAPQPV